MVTMADVAAHAGVSSSTVSHVLNGTRHVNDETRERVERSIDTLGYRRNTAARTLAGGRSGTIGLVISGLTNPYFGPLLQSIERAARDAGYVLVLGDSHDEADVEHATVETLLGRQVEGLILAPSAEFPSTSAPRVAESQTPLVLVDRALPLACDKVTPENHDATFALTEHLIGHGYRRIAAITGLAGLDSTRERERGYRDALEAHGLPVDASLLVSGHSDSAVAHDTVATMLAGGHRPEALLTLNNAMTIGAIRAVREARLRIPDDIALASYDDFEWSDLFSPGLTAIRQDVALMGKTAVELLMRRIRGDSSSFEHRIIQPTLHTRDSCGCPPSLPAEA